jgi:hypothetical protein
VISESNGEAYIGSLHANLALYGWFNCGFVPAFQSTCLIRALECLYAIMLSDMTELSDSG